jgi:hypothetical protein
MGEHPKAIVEHGHDCGDVEIVDGEGLEFVDRAEVWDVRLQGPWRERKATQPDDEVLGAL